MNTVSAYGKENVALKPYLRKYQNVDDNIINKRQANESYQLIKDDEPNPGDNVSN